MSVISNNILAGASGQAGGAAGYEIERSLRFNSADSAYLNRTPSSAGNRKTWTWSGWVKKTASAATDPKTLFGVYGGSASTSFTLRFDSATDDTLRVENDFTVGAPGGRTVAVFRDYSGWMHVVVSMDTTQSSADSGLKMYVNGVQQTLQNTAWTQNIETLVNSTNAHYIGSQGQANSYLDGYLADIHFIDGQALTPTDFGEFDDNGVWQPKAYAGTYGTNGFKLNFSDSSSAAALGTDLSGNNNDWTVNNINNTTIGTALGVYAITSSTNTVTNFPDDLPYTAIERSALPATFSTGTSNFVPVGGISSFSMTMFGATSTTGPWTHLANWTQSETITSATYSSYDYLVFFAYNVSPAPVRGDHVCTVSSSIASGTNVSYTGAYSDTDSLLDSPTNGTQEDTGAGGEVSGNYATWNPLLNPANTLSNGNLDVTAAAGNRVTLSTLGIPASGKWYFEIIDVNSSSGAFIGGVGTAVGSSFLGTDANGWGYQTHATNPVYWHNNSSTSTGAIAGHGSNTVLGVAIDRDTNSIWFSINGTFVNSGNPSAGTGAQYTNLPTSGFLFAGASTATGLVFSLNAGQRAFAYTAPSGFKALNTANLSDPTIADGSDYMDVVTYTGNGTSQSITGLEFEPDFVWIKRRDVATSHMLYDQVRGTGATAELVSNATYSEGSVVDTNAAAFGYLNSFDSNGFTVQAGTTNGVYTNQASSTYVGWTWDAGHPATATTGAVSFDGTGDYLLLPASSDFNFGSGDFTIEFFWYPTSTSRQALYHGSFGADYSIGIDYNSVGTNKLGFWASSNGTSWDIVNADGSGSGITTGEPIQNAWNHIAFVRNGNSLTMYLNGGSVGSITSTDTISLADTDTPVIGAWWNSNSAMSDVHGFISNFRILKGTALYTSNYAPPTVELTNVTNTKLLCCQSTTSATAAAVTPGTITANGDASATTFNPLDAFSVNGTGYATASAAGITAGTIPLTGASVNRSAGFSIVSYTGVDTPSSNTVGHGLNVPPVFWIIKNRTNASPQGWVANFTFLDNSVDYMFLNLPNAKADQGAPWSTLPTSTVFTLGANDGNTCDADANFVAYCFAPVEGYSAFGSYTGNGSTDGAFVYTGFRPKWILIKTTTRTGDHWVMHDSSRSPYNVSDAALFANLPDLESTNTDRLDILSNGFKLRDTSGSYNFNGATYIYACFAENPFKYARAR